MGDFNTAVLFELIREGGYSNHPNDRGGKTQYGITTATFNEAKNRGIIDSSLNNVRDLTPQDAINIYREMYWNEINGDVLPPDLSVVVFDIAVNSGPTASIKMLQNILGVSQDGIIGSQTLSAIENYNGNLVQDMLDAREARYKQIVEDDPSQSVFLKGWLNRVNALRDFVDNINSDGSVSGFSYIPGVGFLPSRIAAIFGTSEIAANRQCDPIILDLDGDGIETVSIQNGTYFDLDADGFAEKIGWVSPDDGFLVMDRDGNGTIDSGRELFGNETLLGNGLRAWNGFEALSELDVNGDGKIDANDPAYSQLRVWKDTNGDGTGCVELTQ